MGNQNKPVLDTRLQSVMDMIDNGHRRIVAPANMHRIIQDASALDPVLGRLASVGMFDSTTTRGGQVRDAAGFALIRELAKVSAKGVEYMEQNLKSVEQIPEVGDAPGIGHSTYEWYYESASGKARWSAELEGNFPSAIVDRNGFNATKLTNTLASYSWSTLDLARAALIPGFSLPEKKSKRCHRMIAEAIDEAVFLGTADIALPGLLNQQALVDNVQNTGGALSGLTPDALYDFFAAHFRAYITKFGDANKFGFHVLLPLSVKLLLDTKHQGTGKQFTVADLLMQSFGGYGFRGCDYNRFMDTAGTGASAMLCIYPRDAEVAGRVTATNYTEGTPDTEGFTTTVKAFGRTGGVAVFRPACIRYGYDL